MRQQQPDILHTHRYKENILGGAASRMSGRARLVKTIHGLPEPFTAWRNARARFYQMLDGLITRRYYDKVICVSREIMDIQTLRLGRERVLCIHNAIDLRTCRPILDRATVRRELGLENDWPTLGAIGRLVRIKGIDVLLEAGRQLRRKVPKLHILVVGEGPQAEALKRRAAHLGLEDVVIFTGFRSDIADVLAALDVFVLPSLSEGVPMIMLEAMAVGVPIVSTRVGGASEILRDGETALLVEPREPLPLASACERMLQDNVLADRLVRSARTYVEEHHSASNMAERVAELYRSLVV
jgi:glycosyltransferase involved in cell wall biosynthesis